MNKWWWYWGPVFGYAGLIFYLSSLPNPGEDIPLPDLGDKSLHVIEYAVLGGLCYRAWRWCAPERVARWAFVLAVVTGALYGISDEWHQSFVPLRESSWLDCVADVIGSVVGAGLVHWMFNGSFVRSLDPLRENRRTS